MNAPVIVNHDDADLPFGDDWDHTDAAIRAEYAVTSAPFYVGSINAAQRACRQCGRELHLTANGAWLDIGPFRLPQRELPPPAIAGHRHGLHRPAAGDDPPPRPRRTHARSGARIAGWDLASSAAELSDGGLSEGEDRP